jgi:GNAT superfamily N-acetyltransferase
VVLRSARPGDEDTLLEIQRASSLAALAHLFPPERHPFPDAAIRDRWRDQVRRDDATTLLAEVEGRAAGLVSFSSSWLESLFVVPERWGSGVAARLHDEAIAALERPCHLWVLEENHRARRFYDRRDWLPDGVRRPANLPPWPPELRYTLDSDSSRSRQRTPQR